MIDVTRGSTGSEPAGRDPRIASALNDRPTGVEIEVGADCEVDDGVIVGYVTGRYITNRRLILGPHARLRSGTVIYAGTTIGSGLETGHNVTVREENVIGDNVSIWNNSTIDYQCRIGANVKIHTNVYIAQYSTLEDDVFLAPGVTIANDPHPGCLHSKDCMRGPTIKRGAQIGCNVTILPYVTIGEQALVGAGSVVVGDVPPRAVVVGNPARVIKMIDSLRCPVGKVDGPCPQAVATRYEEQR